MQQKSNYIKWWMSWKYFFICEQCKMVQYIECYLEYQKFKKFIKRLMFILNLSFIPWKVVRGYEKFILVIFEIYCLISSIYTLVYFEQNLMVFLLRVTIAAGYLQLLTKTLSILTQPNQLKILFLFIEEAHQVCEFDLIVNSEKVHTKYLKKSLGEIKIILK